MREKADIEKSYQGSCIVRSICSRYETSFSRNAAILVLVILSLSSATSSVLSQGQVPVRILGRVMDEDYHGMENFLIKVYSSDGAYVGNITSLGHIASDGYFAASLLPGSYVLHFSKQGYTKVTKSISLKSQIEVYNFNLGDIVLIKTLRLSSSILSLSASPGDELLLSFSVSNTGEESEIVDFKVSKPDDWSAKILGQVGNEIRKIEVSSGKSLSFELEVVIPMSALGSNNLTLTAIGKTNSTLSFTIDVEPKSLISLSSSILSLVASPGDELLLPFTVKNIGEQSEIVDFKISKPVGWSAKILGQVGNEIRKIEVSPSTSSSFQLKVAVPMSALGSNNLTLTAIGKTNSTLSFTIDVEPSSKSMLSCQFPGKISTPGSVVRFQVRLTNPFGVEIRFNVSVDHIPRNWTVSVKSAGGEPLTQINLDKNGFADLVVEATPPDTAKIGEQHRLLFKVESYNGSLRESLPLEIALARVEEEVKIAVASRQITAEAGKTLAFPVTIMNTGDIDRLVLFSVEPPANWKVIFKYSTTTGTMEVSGLYVEAKKSASLLVEATPPSAVGIGTYIIPVKVSSEKGVVYADINLKSTITGSYALTLTPSTLLTSVTIGSSTTFTARITNTGQTSVTSLSLTVTGTPTGWEVSATPIRVELLKPGESYAFTLAVKTTTDTVAGDYLLTLTGSSDQVKSDGVQVRFTATVSTSWGLIGVGMAAVMVFALIVVFMKFRRR